MSDATISPSILNRFQEWYDAYQGRMRAFAYSKITNRDEAEEVLQEFWIKVFKSAGTYEEHNGATVKSWLFKILRRTIIDHGRKIFRQVKFSNVAADPATVENKPLYTEDQRDAFQECVNRLNDTLHSVFQLVLVEGKSNSKAAEILGLSTDIIYQRNSRAKDAIRKCVQQKFKA